MFKRHLRGANPPHRKGTAGLATERMLVPPRITLMMQQHIGAPAKLCVQKGDAVKVGTLIGEAAGPVSANIHSGASGTVEAIGPLMAASGATVQAVVIETDGKQTVDEGLTPPNVHDKESFLQAVRDCGLIGLGGAGFPTAVKLSPRTSVDTLLINAAECEPYITSDDREILENGESVVAGIAATLKWLGIPKAKIGIERNKPEAMDLLFSLCEKAENIEVCPLPTRYPQGAEKVLIEQLTGREVPSDGLPADAGVIVLNVATVSTIGKYLATGMPLVTRRLTVAGGAITTPKNVEVVVGTSVHDVIEFCGGYSQPAEKLLLGGPMMGVALPGDVHPIIKQNNAILALTEAEAKLPEAGPCIRCGRCVNECPVRLSPVETTEAYDRRDLETLQALHAEVCIACGVCSFVCPAKRPLSPVTNLARNWVIREARKKQ